MDLPFVGGPPPGSSEVLLFRRHPRSKYLVASERTEVSSSRGLRPTMAINDAWNSVVDPGAVPGVSTIYGDDTGSTRVVKAHLLLGMIPPSSGQLTSANDNFEALAIAA